MSQAPRRVDLRLTIPAAAPFQAVAAELAGKFAEYAGAGEAAAQEFTRALASSIVEVAGGSDGTEVRIELAAAGRELVATLHSRSTRKLTCPLPD